VKLVINFTACFTKFESFSIGYRVISTIKSRENLR